MNIKEYIGTALKKPLALTNGKAVIAVDFPVIEQSILDILNTPIGTKFFLPEYGSRLDECIFEQNDIVLKTLLRQFIKEAIDQWEKRCRFEDMEVEFEEDRVNCIIVVRVLPSNEIQSFIYPFYKKLNY